MIKAIADLFKDITASEEKASNISERDLHLISATLMAEVMVADGNAGKTELAALEKILREEFCFGATEVNSFVERARQKADNAVSLFEFTDMVNRYFDNDGKFNLILHLWRVARADGVIHKLEEATIRKVAELIYVSHSDFIRAKQLSRPQR